MPAKTSMAHYSCDRLSKIVRNCLDFSLDIDGPLCTDTVTIWVKRERFCYNLKLKHQVHRNDSSMDMVIVAFDSHNCHINAKKRSTKDITWEDMEFLPISESSGAEPTLYSGLNRSFHAMNGGKKITYSAREHGQYNNQSASYFENYSSFWLLRIFESLDFALWEKLVT